MEELRQSLVSVIALHHRDMEKWHYAISLDSNNPNSFASLLGLSDSVYKAFLLKIDLAIPVDGGFRVKSKEWENLIINSQLGDDIYFRKMKVTKVPSSNISNSKNITEEIHNGYWIGIGRVRKQAINPSKQFKLYKRPPRKTRNLKKAINELQSRIKIIIPINTIDRNNEDTSRSLSAAKNKVSNMYLFVIFLETYVFHLKFSFF